MKMKFLTMSLVLTTSAGLSSISHAAAKKEKKEKEVQSSGASATQLKPFINAWSLNPSLPLGAYRATNSEISELWETREQVEGKLWWLNLEQSIAKKYDLKGFHNAAEHDAYGRYWESLSIQLNVLRDRANKYYERLLLGDPDAGKINFENIEEAFKNYSDDELRKLVKSALQENSTLFASRSGAVPPHIPQGWKNYWNSALFEIIAVENRAYIKDTPPRYMNEEDFNKTLDWKLEKNTSRSVMIRSFITFKILGLAETGTRDPKNLFDYSSGAMTPEYFFEKVQLMSYNLLWRKQLNVNPGDHRHQPKLAGKTPSDQFTYFEEFPLDKVMHFFEVAPKAIASKAYLRGEDPMKPKHGMSCDKVMM